MLSSSRRVMKTGSPSRGDDQRLIPVVARGLVAAEVVEVLRGVDQDGVQAPPAPCAVATRPGAAGTPPGRNTARSGFSRSRQTLLKMARCRGNEGQPILGGPGPSVGGGRHSSRFVEGWDNVLSQKLSWTSSPSRERRFSVDIRMASSSAPASSWSRSALMQDSGSPATITPRSAQSIGVQLGERAAVPGPLRRRGRQPVRAEVRPRLP